MKHAGRKTSHKPGSSLWKRMKQGLAVVVVFATTYSLVLPAVTMDLETAAEDPGIYMEEVQETPVPVAEEPVNEPLQAESFMEDTY